ncbi:hypothetical protein B0H14DRAFT_2576153 [Mycena olivaceomarginata]|nr:hypothetical protein B0H14DRAFT_2576153 [Mycena olivaceomarginata]
MSMVLQDLLIWCSSDPKKQKFLRRRRVGPARARCDLPPHGFRTHFKFISLKEKVPCEVPVFQKLPMPVLRGWGDGGLPVTEDTAEYYTDEYDSLKRQREQVGCNDVEFGVPPNLGQLPPCSSDQLRYAVFRRFSDSLAPMRGRILEVPSRLPAHGIEVQVFAGYLRHVDDLQLRFAGQLGAQYSECIYRPDAQKDDESFPQNSKDLPLKLKIRTACDKQQITFQPKLCPQSLRRYIGSLLEPWHGVSETLMVVGIPGAAGIPRKLLGWAQSGRAASQREPCAYNALTWNTTHKAGLGGAEQQA